MKHFTVKEIADMLNTNPETVRRWIRDGKLEAIQVSRKDGNVISESALNKFLSKTPKYASVAASALASGSMSSGIIALTGLSLIATTALIGKIISDNTPIEKIRISADSIGKYISDIIKDHEMNLEKKKQELLTIKKEIDDEQKQIEELRVSLATLNSNSKKKY